ncbi:hypothetical protein IV203_010155 [Nitzschia inconspicua]|uniref:Uncharacterized protein n=1 Tax=Nitzschia inconspicua TaxID=303405 RepID=A0A9K3KVK3_9STRA|nr:hypothetical protein IV203_010155 [Nitzschia inconspicua]
MMYRKRGHDEEDDFSDLKKEKNATIERDTKVRRLDAASSQLGRVNTHIRRKLNPSVQTNAPFGSQSHTRATDGAVSTGVVQFAPAATHFGPTARMGFHVNMFGSLQNTGGLSKPSSFGGGLSMETFNLLNKNPEAFFNVSSQSNSGNEFSGIGINEYLMCRNPIRSNPIAKILPPTNLQLSTTSSFQHRFPNEECTLHHTSLASSIRRQESLWSLRQPLNSQKTLSMRQQQLPSNLEVSAFSASPASLTNTPDQFSSLFLLRQRQHLNKLNESLLFNGVMIPMQRDHQQYQQHSRSILNFPSSEFELVNMHIFSHTGNLLSPSVSTVITNLLQGGAGIQGTSSHDDQVLPPPPMLPRGYGRIEPMSTSTDESSLSTFQCYARKQIEFFEALEIDVSQGARGRNAPITLGQVGIRCRHCRNDAPACRGRAGVYFPTKYELVYQTAVNMTSIHLCLHCRKIPEDTRFRLLELRDQRSTAGGGKKYWAKAAESMGVMETNQGLRFRE